MKSPGFVVRAGEGETLQVMGAGVRFVAGS